MRKAFDIGISDPTATSAASARSPLGAPERWTESLERRRLRQELEAHMAQLGYSSVHLTSGVTPAPEIARLNPVRGHIAYAETVLHSDLRRKQCHERLRFFSQRRTRRRSSILFFIGVAADDRRELEALLARLDIRSGIRGGHVHVVAVPAPENGDGRRAPIATPAGTRRRAAPRTRA